MTKSLEKTRKRIAKKHNGAIDSLHQKSRDAKSLHRASVRAERMAKLAMARNRKEQWMIERVAYFQEALNARGGRPLEPETVRQLVTSFVRRHDGELSSIKKRRRPGRPPSTREDLVRMKIGKLETELQEGFLLPDLTAADNLDVLSRWEGSWSYLTHLSWVRLSVEGEAKPASFPPNRDR